MNPWDDDLPEREEVIGGFDYLAAKGGWRIRSFSYLTTGGQVAVAAPTLGDGQLTPDRYWQAADTCSGECADRRSDLSWDNFEAVCLSLEDGQVYAAGLDTSGRYPDLEVVRHEGYALDVVLWRYVDHDQHDFGPMLSFELRSQLRLALANAEPGLARDALSQASKPYGSRQWLVAQYGQEDDDAPL